ncbi:Slam-dependent surface lipoprotein [Pseudomonas schmalbachii]|uniref:Transferrin-binding protein-like solute binding protein n=1 Tax=Pseudomonas schmalbachii TaxID=2816993 RepID=A0ABS3TQM9_9PSED|nr:Slam-dependent surface lipoprotein [Pseudomonas schmalbachii]MBO3275977.1 transferrin-binding protein-like solute binding protein [Pseudomonas schmalbachii]
MRNKLVQGSKLAVLGFAICLAMGCSSGGGHHFGGDVSKSDEPSKGTDNSSGSNPTGGTDKIAASGATAGTASAQTYVTPTGVTYTLPGVSGVMLVANANGTIDYGSNGANGYARYGTWYSTAHTTTEYFYTGENPTQGDQIPAAGTATYVGKAIRNNTPNGTPVSNGTASVSFNVDFAAKTINGATEERTGFNKVSMTGNLSGGGFNGNATSGAAKGTFTGHFYGADAAELAGMATFSGDATQNIAFGAVKQ